MNKNKTIKENKKQYFCIGKVEWRQCKNKNCIFLNLGFK